MPLPSQKYGALQCSAKSKRSGHRCLNNAVNGSRVCRMHGYVPKDKIMRGESHGMYKHGGRTYESQQKSSEQSAFLAVLEDAMHVLGMTKAKRLRGRKASGYVPVKSIEEVKKLLAD